MKIAILGAYCTKFGELWDKSLEDLLAESQINVIKNAKISPKQIDAIFTGNMCSGILSNQLHLGAIAADILHLNCSSTTVEGGCASGALALRAGISAIESNQAEVVLVNGAEKMTDFDSETITTALMAAASAQDELFIGATFTALNALITKEYMQKFNFTKEQLRDQLAAVSIKNHTHGALNNLAHFQKKISFEEIKNSEIISDPLTLLDCAPISDGAASLIISTPEFAKSHILKNQISSKNQIVYIIGSGQASDTLSLAKRESLTEFKANQIAAQKAFAAAGIKPENINLAEIHDAFTITELIELEDLGFFDKGTAGVATAEGKTKINSQISINPSGGLKSKGHPIGATGISQAYEIVKQLKTESGARQVKNATCGLTLNMGGCGTTSVIHIFSKE